ncbi:MAG: alpha/beta hydrolase, partial [Verrucomicrobia bacterium]|nr:alpha/beta hydrolase [Cytophagales bacterium]
YKNLPDKKQLLLMPETGHDNFLQKEPELWIKAVSNFVKTD